MTLSHNGALLRIRNAVVRKGERGGREVLNIPSLEIEQGENTAILGPNGAGKSSLIKLITQEYRPLAHDNGTAVEIFGRERWDVLELRRSMGIVSADLQRDFLEGTAAPYLRGIDVTLSGFFATRGLFAHQHVTPRMRELADEALARVAARHLAGKLVMEMSSGEVRRVYIARALAPGPRTLLLDEPTAGLDIVSRHGFLSTIRELIATGTTVLLVTHRLEEVVPEIERVVLLRDGTVLYDGQRQDVLTSPRLSEAFGGAICVQDTHAGLVAIASSRTGRSGDSGEVMQ